MALITCPECGKEISDKAPACPHCGNPMASLVEKPKQEVDKDKDELERYLALARRAKEENNGENAARYYDLVLQKDPLNWEASFYQIYFKAMECKIIQIASAARSISNCLDNVLYLIKEHEKESVQSGAVAEVFVRVALAATMLSNGGINHYNNYPTATGAFDECSTRVVAAGNIYDSFIKAVKKNFPEDKKTVSSAAEAYAKYIYNNNRFYNRSWANKEIAALEAMVKETKPDYIASTIPEPAPVTKKSGCYVATAVYGNYDCPEVWTLRRYRDYKLAATWYGRTFIHVYYAISPTIVKYFGKTQWFRKIWKGRLDKMVQSLQSQGYESTPYQDRNW